MLVHAVIFLSNWAVGSPQYVLDNALRDAEPPPALRAAFRASISSGNADRQIEFDPMRRQGDQFHLIASHGDDPELDKIVSDWAAERQPDVRLFADDLRQSLGAGRIVADGGSWRVVFRHRLSQNDGPVDAMVSENMEGGLKIDPETGGLQKLEYKIREPFRTPDGSVVDSYRQVYTFGRSERWGVTFVVSYDLEASGGRFGVHDSRAFTVQITDIAFTLAGDARQELESKGGGRYRGGAMLVAGAGQ